MLTPQITRPYVTNLHVVLTPPPLSFSLSIPDSDSVFVHIIKSEQHAAMQHELGVRMELPNLLLLLLLGLLWVNPMPRPLPLLPAA